MLPSGHAAPFSRIGDSPAVYFSALSIFPVAVDRRVGPDEKPSMKLGCGCGPLARLGSQPREAANSGRPIQRVNEEMGNLHKPSRRDRPACWPASAAAGLNAASMSAETIRRTPSQILGLFNPVAEATGPRRRPDRHLPVATGRAAGEVIEVMGRIINRRGEPVAGARIEIWQANTHGRYTHPSDRNVAPLDPNFEGYALADHRQ